MKYDLTTKLLEIDDHSGLRLCLDAACVQFIQEIEGGSLLIQSPVGMIKTRYTYTDILAVMKLSRTTKVNTDK